MNQAEVTKLVSRLRIPYGAKHRRLRNPEGPLGRVKRLRALITALIKYERIEVMHYPGDEARGYVERLISDAIRHGDQHAATMDMANFWIEEKQQVHKLFKVLVPRFEKSSASYTRMLNAPIPVATPEDSYPYFRSIIELRGNPFPPIVKTGGDSRLLIQNVLLEEAKKEFRAAKYAEIARDLEAKAEVLDTKTEDLEAKVGNVEAEANKDQAVEDKIEGGNKIEQDEKIEESNSNKEGRETASEKSSEPK